MLGIQIGRIRTSGGTIHEKTFDNYLCANDYILMGDTSVLAGSG
jgi:hypothetical protein